MRACPRLRPKGACARCLSGFPTSGFGRRLNKLAAVKAEVVMDRVPNGIGPSRHVGRALAAAIVAFPGVFAWFLLRAGHSAKARLAGFAWLAVSTVVVLAIASAPERPEEMAQRTRRPHRTTSIVNEMAVKPWRETDGGVAISRIEFEGRGLVWPLIVEEAIVGCEPSGLMWVKANRRRYALTGAGKANEMYKAIEEIWIENAGEALAKNPGEPRVPIKDLFNLSKSMC